MKTWVLTLALLGAGSSSGSVLLQTQSDACLDTPINCSFASSGTLHDGGNFNTFTESAVASFGILHVTASSTFNVTNGFALSLGFVSFTEDLTITSPSHANGTAGFLNLGYFIDGTTTTTGGGNAFLQVIARDYKMTDLVNPVVNYVKDYNTNTKGVFVVPTAMPFTYGTKFELSISMQATAGSIEDTGNGGYNANTTTASGTATTNFFNTLVVDQLQTLDGSSAPVADSVIVGDSGTSYSQAGVTPEPGTWMLVGLAIPALLLRAKFCQRLCQN